MFMNTHQLEAASITGSARASSLFNTKIRIADQANHGTFMKPQGRSPKDGRPLLSKGIADVINTNKGPTPGANKKVVERRYNRSWKWIIFVVKKKKGEN